MNENIRSHYFENDDKMHEECGVFGMYDFDNNDVATSIYYGLFCIAASRTGELWYRSIRHGRSQGEGKLHEGHGSGKRGVHTGIL